MATASDSGRGFSYTFNAKFRTQYNTVEADTPAKSATERAERPGIQQDPLLAQSLARAFELFIELTAAIFAFVALRAPMTTIFYTIFAAAIFAPHINHPLLLYHMIIPFATPP
jgi:nucleoside permease NupC